LLVKPRRAFLILGDGAALLIEEPEAHAGGYEISVAGPLVERRSAQQILADTAAR
jgi:hypothetical protein